MYPTSLTELNVLFFAAAAVAVAAALLVPQTKPFTGKTTSAKYACLTTKKKAPGTL